MYRYVNISSMFTWSSWRRRIKLFCFSLKTRQNKHFIYFHVVHGICVYKNIILIYKFNIVIVRNFTTFQSVVVFFSFYKLKVNKI